MKFLIYFLCLLLKVKEIYLINEGDYNLQNDREYDIDPADETDIHKVEINRKIVNRHDFEFIHNPGREFCYSQDKLFLLVYVHTAPKNFKRRMAIRETWAKQSMFRDIRTVFIMGIDANVKIMEQIKLENGIYKDIVQENFEDSYKNLTYKGIAALKWITNYCNNAKFILKTDDDIITDVFLLFKHVNSLNEHNMIKPRTILCHVWSRMKVMREKKNKWYVSKEEYRHEWFGKYCSGSAFIFTSDLVGEMFRISFHVRFVWVDDYYISGLLARAVGANFERINSLYTISPFLIEQRFTQKSRQTPVFGHSPFKINLMYSLWSFVLFKNLAKHSDLVQPQSSLILKDDFKFLEDFHWSFDIWKEYSEEKSGNVEKYIQNKFYIDSF